MSCYTFLIFTTSIGICICVIKSPGQASSTSRVEAQKRCGLSLNKEYTSHWEGGGGDDTNLQVSDSVSDRRESTDCLPQPVSHRFDVLDAEGLPKFSLDNQFPFRAPSQPEQPHTPLCRYKDSKDESVMVEGDLGRRPRTIEFTLGQSFYEIGHFHDALKVFAIVNNFELEHIKIDNRRVMSDVYLKIARLCRQGCPKFHDQE